MGLYLATSSSTKEVARGFTRLFFGVCGDQDSALSLNSNGTFSLEILNRESPNEDRYESGTWQATSSVVQLKLGSETSEFSIAEFETADQRPGLRLSALSENGQLGQCIFSSPGLTRKNFNNIFSIVDAEGLAH